MTKPSAKSIQKELLALAKNRDPQRVSKYFKTTPGSYGAHDRFLGLMVPELRTLAKKYHDLDLTELTQFLDSPFNEIRLFALIILVNRYKKADTPLRKKIYQLYIKHINTINNWNLVDSSARYIIGSYLWETHNFSPLNKWILSKNLWHRRIAIVASHHFILNDHFDETLRLSQLIFNDPEDLMHKATGWMLREVGKRNRKVLVDFLKSHQHKMPAIMRSYAREHLRG